MTTKIFWPDDVPIDSEGLIYGWRLSDDWYVVADIASSTSRLESALASGEDLEQLDLQRGTSARYESQYITYKCPNIDRLRFYSLQPPHSHSDAGSGNASSQYSASRRLEELYDRYHATQETGDTSFRHRGHLDRTINLINTTHHIRTRASNTRRTIAAASSRIAEPDTSSKVEPSGESGEPNSVTSALPDAQVPLSSVVPLAWLGVHDCDVLRWVRSSAIVRQVLRRAKEMRDLPQEWLAIRSKDISLEEKSRRYINFYNTVWLVANDLIVGWTISSILREQSTVLEHFMNQVFQRLFMSNIIDGLRWLDDWPVGLKLNTPLSRLFCETYIGMANVWPAIIARTPMTTSIIISSLAWLSLFGTSMFLSAFSDTLALATLHVRLATRVSGAIYRAEMIALYSLWNLFRGKRWNTLRNRVDSYDYGIDQLFLGTLLFTIALFLLPTIATYYLFFAIIQLALLYVQGANDTALSFINSFPLFILMLRLKEPSRLPGGVSFQLKRHASTQRFCLKLINMPIGAGLIFRKFVADWHLLSAGYSPHLLLKRLVRGTL